MSHIPNGAVSPYGLPDLLKDKTLLPANGTRPIDLSYHSKGYMATVCEPVNAPPERESFYLLQCHGTPRPGIYLGYAQTRLRGRLYMSEAIYMLPDCFGNLAEVRPW